ncbi:GTP pyrophosphokinase family protein [Rhodococcus hoagii]|uniref:GTP pyrophosphokinase n=1 Tax=Rhodococcus hoagii TaxID=43767 RepID=UPI0007CD69D6|nr:GTP pyrophosphokinase family protein [Prescottella equi]MBM4533654.1 GTP pyrophosphokinase family protein [Prescottella equi]NKR84365.1 GTP pyrophosphokinase family protein [Prescottella equi]ORJ96480.1 GTP pyrophosphokinase [Prescottella equi]ORL06927.1 GTP pyrophosphokinase [Prescottella equi]ORL76081.1 GTP pyrophosphokinase [Prescottella equi]
MDPEQLRTDFSRFMMAYRFGITQLLTKVNILKDEFTHINLYSPIEHVTSRLKTPESIIRKANRIGCPLTLDDVREQILDIAGVRITCSFIADTYRIADMITSQPDIEVREVEDYIAKPKPNGYKSLHLIVEVPVYLSDRVQQVPIELQIRTIAMDFWASLEHKIYYKFNREVPPELLAELTEAAETAHRLDMKMERLNEEFAKLKAQEGVADEAPALELPPQLLDALQVRLSE